jgi:hypothetical protein
MKTWMSYSDRLRSMYPGGRADGRARRLSILWATVFGLGLGPRRWVSLEVTGRKSAPAERAEILRRYLGKVPGARPHIPVSLHAPVADFAAIAPKYLVFRVVTGEGGEP